MQNILGYDGLVLDTLFSSNADDSDKKKKKKNTGTEQHTKEQQ